LYLYGNLDFYFLRKRKQSRLYVKIYPKGVIIVVLEIVAGEKITLISDGTNTS
jgi:hypothetical protein